MNEALKHFGLEVVTRKEFFDNLIQWFKDQGGSLTEFIERIKNLGETPYQQREDRLNTLNPMERFILISYDDELVYRMTKTLLDRSGKGLDT